MDEELHTAYTAVDRAIVAWADHQTLKLSTQIDDQERRFFYVTGGPQECFQVTIELLEKRKVLLNAWSVETIDDADLHECWLVPIDEVSSALKLAFETITAWNVRPKAPATW